MDQQRETPSQVVGALAAGVAPVPLLMIYSVLFIGRGFVVHVEPPDITSTRSGEGMVGLFCVVLLIAVCVSMYWFLEATRRWPFLVMQAGSLFISCVFFFGDTWGDPQVPFITGILALVALGLAVHPASWEWMDTAGGKVSHDDRDLSEEHDLGTPDTDGGTGEIETPQGKSLA